MLFRSGDAESMLDELRGAGAVESRLIGRVRGAGEGRIFLLGSMAEGSRVSAESDCCAGAQKKSAGGCCDDVPAEAAASSSSCCGEASSGCCDSSSAAVESGTGCCAGESASGTGDAGDAGGSGALAVRGKFAEFLGQSSSPGELDVLTKEAISLALSLAMRCEPCVKIHLSKARKMGFSQAQIDEIANLAIAFGGAPVMMLNSAICREK